MTQQPKSLTLTLKQWQRRALKAEETVALLQRIRTTESQMEFDLVRELSAARVALAEIRDAANCTSTVHAAD